MTNHVNLSTFIAGFWRLKNWGMTAQEVLAFIEQCVESGVTSMDHAMVYRSEAPFGEALALKPELREKIQIITKFGIRPTGFGKLGAEHVNHYDSSPDALIESVENSLRDFKTDYIDVLLIHRPDYLMDPQEIAEAFSTLKQDGKVKHFGISNFTTAQFEMLQSILPMPLITNQIELSPYNMQALDDGTLEQCMRFKIQPMLWSCLAAGELLNPKDKKGERILNTLRNIAEELNADSIEQVVYAWVLKLPCKPLPLLGSSKIERIKSAVKSLDLTMSQEQWYAIWEASNGSPVP